MGIAITQGISITAKATYEPAHSDPQVARFIFSYRITIKNSGEEAVQLLRRHWVIRDSLSATREVEGPGVVGETPVLKPGDEFSYESACDLRSGFGRMDGTYLMQRMKDGSQFRVTIPEIHLISPSAAN